MNLHSVVNSIEKMATFRFFFLYASFIIGLDTYLIVALNCNLYKFSIELAKNNIGAMLMFLAFFSLISKLLPSVIAWFIKSFLCKKRKESEFEKENYIDKDSFLKLILQTQNKVDYDYLREQKREYDEITTLRNYAILFMSAMIADCCFSNSIVSVYETYLNTHKILSVIVSFLMLALVLFLQNSICAITNKVYYPKR